MRSYGINLRTKSNGMLKVSILDMSFKIMDLELQTYFQVMEA